MVETKSLDFSRLLLLWGTSLDLCGRFLGGAGGIRMFADAEIAVLVGERPMVAVLSIKERQAMHGLFLGYARATNKNAH